MDIRSCKQCQSTFTVTDSDLAFYDKISPTFVGKKYSIPTPTLCPDCRQQRRLAQQNIRTLYKGKSSLSGKSLISIYSPDKPYTIYTPDERLSDQFDFRSYGREIDFSTSLLQQFNELYKSVPKRNIILWWGSENCDYVNGVGGSKNSYLIFNTTEAQDCYYSDSVNFSKNCVDCSFVDKSDHCYMCLDCNWSFNLHFWQDCSNCADSYYLFNCSNCHHCVACYNLQNAEYCISNKSYTKEEYEQKKNELLSHFTLDNFVQMKKSCVVKNLNIINSENAIGDKIYNSKNIYYSYGIEDGENIAYSTILINGSKDCYDVDQVGNHISNNYDSTVINRFCSKIYFTYDCRHYCEDMFYSIACRQCKNVFFCNWLRGKEYCILNKQYTKAEYEQLVPQIIEKMQADGERWEFFPSSISPFGYNETLAMEYFPLTKEEALAKWFKRSDYEAPLPKTDAKDVIICEVSKKQFRLIPQEIEFYKKHNLPQPTKHPDVRHEERMKLRNPRKLRDRKCAKCSAEIKTSYAPERPEIVYCEQCYNREIYG